VIKNLKATEIIRRLSYFYTIMKKEILKSDCVQLGYIRKPHALSGEVELVFDPGMDLTLEEIEWVFLDIENGLVPFFIPEEGLRFKSDTSAYIHFEDIDNQESAKRITGCKVFVFQEDIVQGEEELTPSYLLNFKVADQTQGDLGVITEVNDYSGNLVVTVEKEGKEIILPLADELIISMDEKKREMLLDCPEGLIELND